MDFDCRENANGTFEVFNTKIGDIYFSNVGAYKEALEKFVLPSLPVLQNKNKIKILDVCYGMGYNSKTFVDYILKNKINIKYDIDGIEIDKNILAFGLLIFDKNIGEEINLEFGREILNQLNLEENIKKISGENWIKSFLPKFCPKFNEFCQKNMVYLYQNNFLSTFLHNIYYQNQSNFKNISNFRLFNVDLHDFLQENDSTYDLIFHDAFSILKQPDMWSEDVMQSYYDIINKNGRFLTYSNSRVLRRTLEKVGFEVEINFDDNSKQNGTIGIKS